MEYNYCFYIFIIIITYFFGYCVVMETKDWKVNIKNYQEKCKDNDICVNYVNYVKGKVVSWRYAFMFTFTNAFVFLLFMCISKKYTQINNFGVQIYFLFLFFVSLVFVSKCFNMFIYHCI